MGSDDKNEIATGARRGILDGFEEFTTLTTEDRESAIQDGLVVLDTNVLLNLYRYEKPARNEFMTVLTRLQERLAVPHRVAVEFWRNREGVLDARSNLSEDVVSRLDALISRAEDSLGEWRNRSGSGRGADKALIDGIRDAVAAAQASVRESAAGSSHPSDISQDQVLKELQTILDGCVEAPADAATHESDVKEGRRRVEAKIPPGFKDAKKTGDDASGDYLVWRQALRAAQEHALPWLVFVTADSRSDDWFRRESGQTRGPRRELVREALDVAGVQLLLLTPDRFIALARDTLDLEVSDETLESVSSVTDTATLPGWRRDTIDEFLLRIQSAGPIQHKAILAAADNGGTIGREEVYGIGGYDAERTLRGFTRPATRVAQEMMDDRLIQSSVEDPLRTLYDSPDSYVVASGFRVPDEFVDVLTA